MEREIIVVGAGPAGATAAMSLAQKGRDVLLLDRQDFPRDKSCGDGIPSAAVSLLYQMGMREKVLDAGFYMVNKLSIVSPRGQRLKAELPQGEEGANSYIVPRLKFDYLLKEHAIDCGAEFQKAHVKEPLMDNGRVVGVRARVNGAVKDIQAKIVIAADGVTSAIARTLQPRPHEEKHRAVALRAYIQDIQELPNEVEFYLYNEILPGYAWIFPLGEGKANVGLGMRLDKFRKKKESLEDMLHHFLEMPVMKERLKKGVNLYDLSTWQLNFGSQKHRQYAFDGALLTGDAAGFINPLTGGGIYNGMLSARLVAEVVHEGLSKNDVSRSFLSIYEKLCHEKMWSGMRRSHFIQRLLINFPFIVDLIVRLGGEESEFVQTFVDKL